MYKHKPNSFVAWILRLKFIKRWPLMNNLVEENCSAHCFEVAVVAHAIALIGVEKYNRAYNPSDIAVAGLYHEASESAGSDLPSPVKYANPDITKAFKKLENDIEESLVSNSLPDYLQKHLKKIVIQREVNKDIKAIVKAADDISAYLKTRGELSLNNLEHYHAEKKLRERLITHCKSLPEVQTFVDTQMACCLLTLDELSDVDSPAQSVKLAQ